MIATIAHMIADFWNTDYGPFVIIAAIPFAGLVSLTAIDH